MPCKAGLQALCGQTGRKRLETQDMVEQVVAQSAWGIASSFDVYGCDPDAIRSAEKIRRFVADQLVELGTF